MAERESPLVPLYRPGSHGNFAAGAGVRLLETRPGSIVQAAAWPGEESRLAAAIAAVTGLALPEGPGAGAADGRRAAFGFAPGRVLVVDQQDGLAAMLSGAIASDIGTVTDLSHGRTAIRISGDRAEWVLSKLFAIDFAPAAFPVGAGRATLHHDVSALIQRTGERQFDLYVFRSFARSFWTMLCHAAAEVGYEVA
jgi:sarcosine oxidase subunit gamma